MPVAINMQQTNSAPKLPKFNIYLKAKTRGISFS